MPANYRIDHNTVFTIIEGRMIDKEMINIQVKLRKGPEFKPDYSHLIDRRQIGELKKSAAWIRTITSSGMFSAQSRRAFVVPSDTAYGFSRMFQVYRQHGLGQTEVFRDFDQAVQWIGLE